MTTNDPSPIWNAAAKFAHETNRPDPLAVLILNLDGWWDEIGADGKFRDVWDSTPGEFPAAIGWSFRAGLVAFNGRPFRVGGLRYKLLRALVDGRGQPVADRVLKARVWADDNVEDGRLKDVAFGLRAVLRAELGLSEDVDPVERLEGGYRLTIS